MTVSHRVVWRPLLVMIVAVVIGGGCATVDPWTDTRIESERRDCESRLRFQYRIEIVEHCVWRIRSESR